MPIRSIDSNTHQLGERESLTRVRRTLADMRGPDGLWTQVEAALSSPFYVLGPTITATPHTYPSVASRLQAIELYLLLSEDDGGGVDPDTAAAVDRMIADLYTQTNLALVPQTPRLGTGGLFYMLTGATGSLQSPAAPGLLAALGTDGGTDWAFLDGLAHDTTLNGASVPWTYTSLSARLDNVDDTIDYMLDTVFSIVQNRMNWTIPSDFLSRWPAATGSGDRVLDFGAGRQSLINALNSAWNSTFDIPDDDTRDAIRRVITEMYAWVDLMSSMIRKFGFMVADLQRQDIFGGTPPF